MIQLTQKGLVITNEVDVASLQMEFSERHCIVLPAFIHLDLLEKILQHLEVARFHENEHRGPAKEIFATDLTIEGKNAALHQINFLMNNKNLFRTIEEITQCTGIRGFAGRIYRNMPGAGHHLDWHDDTEDNTRIVAASISLNKHLYSGGLFQLRDKKTKQLYREVGACGLGDMHVFRVSPLLEHRVTPAIGENSRTAAAGWFTSEEKSLFSFLSSK